MSRYVCYISYNSKVAIHKGSIHWKTEVKKMKEMNQKFCQCCGLPMGNRDELYGTNVDGSKNEEYCKYCFENGEVTFKGTMEEMIEVCVPNMVAANPNMKEEEARKIMFEWFPTLKYWKR
jgi:hypothetical protein